jgi:hypothetical protein
LLDDFLILWRQNEPATGLCTTGTGMGGSVIQLIAVIIGEFFAWRDVP